ALFDMPVTAVQIWRALVLDRDPPAGGDSRLRWQGQHLPKLSEVRRLLGTSAWLQQRLGTAWGYFFLRGKEESVRRRLNRHVIAQHKWRLTRKLAKYLALVPCVRMIAGSGSLALSNTRPSSDLDMFVIVRGGRIWTTRLLLLLVAQLLGRRRKYWDRQAPDRLCFNHFITDTELTMPAAVRNLYTAVAYSHLVPLFGVRMWSRFEAANGAWIRNFLMYPDTPPLLPKQGVALPFWVRELKNFFEEMLLEPLGEFLERSAEKRQRRAIREHTQPGRSGRVAISPTELAFHPDSRVPDILSQFAQDAGQKTLL
ncbi:MAG: hypothetical protein AAB538_02045, partial [Patescibacteria group bacterium]